MNPSTGLKSSSLLLSLPSPGPQQEPLFQVDWCALSLWTDPLNPRPWPLFPPSPLRGNILVKQTSTKPRDQSAVVESSLSMSPSSSLSWPSSSLACLIMTFLWLYLIRLLPLSLDTLIISKPGIILSRIYKQSPRHRLSLSGGDQMNSRPRPATQQGAADWFNINWLAVKLQIPKTNIYQNGDGWSKSSTQLFEESSKCSTRNRFDPFLNWLRGREIKLEISEIRE